MKGSKILIVDDLQQNIELLKAFLDRKGYCIIEANNGQEALDKVVQESPDLVLLDVLMPEMDGFEVCRKIKFEMGLYSLPIIMVTALNAREDRLKGLESGADDFISKPVDWAELTVRVNSLLRLKSTHDELSSSLARLNYQLDLARGVQQALVKPPAFPQLKLETFYHPAEKIGGDLYQIVKLDENKFGLFIADCAGHGVPAALIMVMVKLIFNSLKLNNMSPGQVLSKVNHSLLNIYNDNIKHLFVTAVYVIVDKNTQTLHWANGGHPFPIIIKSKQTWDLLNSGDTPLGIMKGMEFNTHTLKYPPNSKLLMYTDGLAQFLSPERETLEKDIISRVTGDLLKTQGNTTSFYKKLKTLLKNKQPSDDICYVLLNL